MNFFITATSQLVADFGTVDPVDLWNSEKSAVIGDLISDLSHICSNQADFGTVNPVLQCVLPGNTHC